MLSYPPDLAQALLESFERLSQWRLTAPERFVHSNGVQLNLNVYPQGTGDVSLPYDTQILEQALGFSAPSIVQKSTTAVLGTLHFGTTSVSEEIFQRCLHEQWGLGALERLQALSHVLAQTLDCSEGAWYDQDEDDDFVAVSGQSLPSPWPAGSIYRLLRRYNLCTMNTQGGFFAPKGFPLQLYPSAHEQLAHSASLEWARRALDQKA